MCHFLSYHHGQCRQWRGGMVARDTKVLSHKLQLSSLHAHFTRASSLCPSPACRRKTGMGRTGTGTGTGQDRRPYLSSQYSQQQHVGHGQKTNSSPLGVGQGRASRMWYPPGSSQPHSPSQPAASQFLLPTKRLSLTHTDHSHFRPFSPLNACLLGSKDSILYDLMMPV